jgi:hypothetical protein
MIYIFILCGVERSETWETVGRSLVIAKRALAPLLYAHSLKFPSSSHRINISTISFQNVTTFYGNSKLIVG